jgi:dTDP-4-amino-4,6-dideoxy-D-glucose acyltransferase
MIISRTATVKRHPFTSGHAVKIDDRAYICRSTELTIGHHVHIATDVTILGAGKVELRDYCGLSPGVLILSSSDDFSGDYLTGPTVDSDCVNVDLRPIIVGRHVVVGARSVILPGVTIGDYSAIGAMSLVRHDVPSGEIWGGNPLRFIKKRNRERLKELENA